MLFKNKNKPRNLKKDKLSDALKTELTKSGLSDFASDMKKNKINKADKVTLPPKEDKKTLPFSKISTSEKLLENNTKQKLKIGLKTKNIFIIIGGISLFVSLYYAFWGGGLDDRAVYLSSHPIQTSHIKSLNINLPTFSLGKPIYVHFSMGSSLNLDSIRIKVVNTVSNIEHPIGEVSATVKSNWKHVQTYFQKEFFEEVGNYKIKILKSNGILLAERSFKIL